MSVTSTLVRTSNLTRADLDDSRAMNPMGISTDLPERVDGSHQHELRKASMDMPAELQHAVELARERENATAKAKPHKVDNASSALVRRRPLSRQGDVRVRRGLVWARSHAELRGSVLLVNGSPHEVAAASAGQRRREVRIRPVSGGHDVHLRLDTTADATGWLSALARAGATPPTLRDFDILAPIGRGGGGEVHLVRRRGGARLQALKVVRKENVFGSNAALRHAIDERLALELARGCPFVARLEHAFQDSRALYHVTEFCAGGDLRAALSRAPKGRFDEEMARHIFSQLVLALQHVHALAVIYRDLKPENVLLTAKGDVRLCDFGLAKVLATGRLGRTRSFCGTTQYMSPEVLSARGARRSYGTSTDLWSLGALFFRVLTGYAPFDDLRADLVNQENDAHQIYKRIQLDDLTVPRWLSAEAREMLEGLLTKREEDRWNLGDLFECAFFANVSWDNVLEQGRRNKMQAEDTLDMQSATANFHSAHIRAMTLLSQGSVGGIDTGKKKNKLSKLRDALTKRPNSTDIVGYGFSLTSDITPESSLFSDDEQASADDDEEKSFASFASFARFGKRRTSEKFSSFMHLRVHDEF